MAALGTDGFVRPAEPGNKAEIVPGVEWWPYKVDLPLACTLPDVLTAELAGLSVRRGRRAPRPTRQAWAVFSPVLQWVVAVLGVEIPVRSGPVPVLITLPIFQALEQVAALLGRRRSRTCGRGSFRSRRSASDVQQALEHVIRDWSERARQFERDEPASNLQPDGPETASPFRKR